MKTIIAAILLGCLVLAGCSGVQVREPDELTDQEIEMVLGPEKVEELVDAITINPDMTDEELEGLIGEEKMKEIREFLGGGA